MKSKILFSFLCLSAFVAATNVDIPITLSTTNTNQLTVTLNAQNEWEIAIGSGDPIDPYVFTEPLTTPYTSDVKYLSFEYYYEIGGAFDFYYFKPSNGSEPVNISQTYFTTGDYLAPTNTWRTKVIDLSKETGWFDAQAFRFDFGSAQNVNLKLKNIKLSNYQDISKTMLFNYTMEDNLNDVSGKDNHAVFGSSDGSGAMAYDNSGKVGRAASFDNQANWFESPANLFTPGNDFTIDLWVKLDGTNTSTFPTIIQQTGNGKTILGIEKSKEQFFFFMGTTYYFTTHPVYNDWMHIVMVFQQTRQKFKVYINDVLDSEISGVAYSGNVFNNTLRFGEHRNPGVYATKDFMGLLDEVKLYNTSLSLFNLNTSSNDITKGTVTASTKAWEGSEVTVTATPKAGNSFVNWTENGAEVSTSTSYTFTANGDRTLVANFSIGTAVSNIIQNNTTVSFNADNVLKTSNTVDKIRITDLNGRNVKNFSNTAEANLSNLNKGMYVVNVITFKGENIYKKIVKN